MAIQKKEKINFKDEPKHGKQVHQKVKPYVVLQFLLRNSDENKMVLPFRG